MTSNPALSVTPRPAQADDPFAMQLALSRVHSRLVPMRQGPSGYELDPVAEDWCELPVGRGFAGYGLGRALRMLLDVLRGLTALHDTFDAAGRSFAHGEVALPQLRVDAEGVCRLVPLSARHASGLEAPLPPEHFGYFAPERLLGEPLDARADVFSAGVLLWEALAGRRLFDEGSAEAIIDRLMGEKLLMPRLPPELAWAIALKSIAARALAVDPYQRFADCAELATAIAIVARDRVATHTEIANFFGAKPRSTGSSACQRPIPSQSSTFPAVGSRPASRSGSTLAALGPSRSFTPAPALGSPARSAARSAPHKSAFSTLLSAGTHDPAEPASVALTATHPSLRTAESANQSANQSAEAAPTSSDVPRSSKRPPPLPAWAQAAALAPPAELESEAQPAPAVPAAVHRPSSRRLWGIVALLSLAAILAAVALASQKSALAPTTGNPAPALGNDSPSNTGSLGARTRLIDPGTSEPLPNSPSSTPRDPRPAGPRSSTKGAPPAKGVNLGAKDYGI